MNSMDSTQPIKRCRICGDQAICFNFDVLTCGSCRLFFYRNVSRHENWKCPRKGQCKITVSNRTFCRKCRMDKCIHIGMRSKSKSPQYNKTEENSHQTQIVNQTNQIVLPKVINEDSFEINPTELQCISELRNSTASIFNFKEVNLPILYEETNVYRTMNLGQHYVRRIIKYCKSKPIFCAIDPPTQLILLKQFIGDFLVIRHSFDYDAQRQGYYVLGNEDGSGTVFCRLSVFGQMPDGGPIVQDKRQHSYECMIQMENDETIRDLLIIQSLFNSNGDLPVSESFRYQYWMYQRLFIRYLQCKYKSIEKAQEKYSTLMNLVANLKVHKRAVIAAIHKLDQDCLDQLTCEVLNFANFNQIKNA